MPTFHGSYTAKRDGKTYAYDVSWQAGAAAAVWEARVRLGSTLVALPSGRVVLGAGADPVAAVRGDVEAAIEHRISLDC
jgi:hypothetical protein